MPAASPIAPRSPRRRLTVSRRIETPPARPARQQSRRRTAPDSRSDTTLIACGGRRSAAPLLPSRRPSSRPACTPARRAGSRASTEGRRGATKSEDKLIEARPVRAGHQLDERQVAMLTKHIDDLTDACAPTRRTTARRRGLLKLVGAHPFLTYLQKPISEGYHALIKELGLRRWCRLPPRKIEHDRAARSRRRGSLEPAAFRKRRKLKERTCWSMPTGRHVHGAREGRGQELPPRDGGSPSEADGADRRAPRDAMVLATAVGRRDPPTRLLPADRRLEAVRRRSPRRILQRERRTTERRDADRAHDDGNSAALSPKISERVQVICAF